MSADDRAHSYANALYESAWERWLATLSAVADKLAQDLDLQTRLQTSGVDFAQRQRLLDGILPEGTDPLVRNLLSMLMQRSDLAALPDVIAALQERVRQTKTGPTEVEVTSAVPLSGEQRQTLVASLEQQQGAGLDVRYRVDPTILGGLIVRIGDRLIDNSLATRLSAMKQALGVRIAE